MQAPNLAKLFLEPPLAVFVMRLVPVLHNSIFSEVDDVAFSIPVDVCDSHALAIPLLGKYPPLLAPVGQLANVPKDLVLPGTSVSCMELSQQRRLFSRRTSVRDSDVVIHWIEASALSETGKGGLRDTFVAGHVTIEVAVLLVVSQRIHCQFPPVTYSLQLRAAGAIIPPPVKVDSCVVLNPLLHEVVCTATMGDATKQYSFTSPYLSHSSMCSSRISPERPQGLVISPTISPGLHRSA
jgi:hypothetical protein